MKSSWQHISIRVCQVDFKKGRDSARDSGDVAELALFKNV